MKRAAQNLPNDCENSRGASSGLTAVKPTARSCVTNGSGLFLGAVDGRSREARRWRDLFRHYMVETDSRNEQLCRQLASLVVRREALDSEVAAGKPVDIDLLLRLSSEIRRSMTRLGLLADPEDEPIDATDQVVAALKANLSGEAA